VGQPHAITKFLMLRDIHALRWGALLTGGCYALLSLLWMSIGLAMRTLVERGQHAPLESPDLAAPIFLLNYTPELLAGIVFAGLLAAIMSTADSFVNIGAAAIVHDIPTALRGRPLDRQLLWSRIATFVLLVAAALFALYMENLIALLGTFGWGTFAAAIVPSVALGLNWKRATAAACVTSIALSLVLNFSLELLHRHNIYALPYGFNVGCFSLLVSLIAFVAISLLSRDTAGDRIAPDVRAAMEV
jgi:Na+/proline symporter